MRAGQASAQSEADLRVLNLSPTCKRFPAVTRSTLLALPFLVAALPAAAQSLPDGLYNCWIGSMNLGQIEMTANEYRGPAHDGAFEDGPYPYTMDGPTITWGGPLGGITLAGTVVSAVAKGAEDGTLSGFDIMLQNADSGNFQTVSCYAPE